MRQLCKGNVAVVKAAILAGCRSYYGYPITPASEIAEYASLLIPQVGGTFLQAESEVAAINMVYGAAAAGVRVMTASSGPGLSLMQEGMSYLAGAELLGVPPEECVVFEDSESGVKAGHAAGCAVIATTFSHEAEHLECANYLLRDLAGVEVSVLPDGEGLCLRFAPLER